MRLCVTQEKENEDLLIQCTAIKIIYQRQTNKETDNSRSYTQCSSRAKTEYSFLDYTV